MYYKLLIISAKIVAWFANLVFLRRRHRASRVALVSNGKILALVYLLSQMYIRQAEIRVAREYSVVLSKLNSSKCRREAADMAGMYIWATLRRFSPVPLL